MSNDTKAKNAFVIAGTFITAFGFLAAVFILILAGLIHLFSWAF